MKPENINLHQFLSNLDGRSKSIGSEGVKFCMVNNTAIFILKNRTTLTGEAGTSELL